MIKQLTLCLIHRDNKILLGFKKRGFGEGLWNGFGGKLQEGENVEEAAKREFKEESGLEIVNFEKVGILKFSFQNDPKILEVHIFKINDFLGIPEESEEMKPEWFDINKIPFNQMWTADSIWIPLFLDGKKFKGKFHFDRPSDKEYRSKILNQEISEID